MACAAVLDGLLTESLTALVTEGLVNVTEVAIDGTKVRASAGKNSFSGEDRLTALEHRMAERVAQLKAELQADPAASEKRRHAAALRGAAETTDRRNDAGLVQGMVA